MPVGRSHVTKVHLQHYNRSSTHQAKLLQIGRIQFDLEAVTLLCLHMHCTNDMFVLVADYIRSTTTADSSL